MQIAGHPHSVNFYGLLFVSEQDRHTNLKKRGTAAIDVYCQTALLTFKSLRHFGLNFSILTNDAAQLRQRYDALGLTPPPLIEEDFELDVPKDVAFFAAHYKLEIFKKFASTRFGNYVGLIDIDTVMHKPWTPQLQDALVVVDISREMIAVTNRDRIRLELSKMADFDIPDPRWYGGEYFYGPAEQFSNLAKLCDEIWPRYVADRALCVHQGDEMAGSAALNRMRILNPDSIIDGDKTGIICRWWSARTGWKQPPLSSAFAHSILHLPADKLFLSKEAKRNFDPDGFRTRYRSYARKKMLSRRIVNRLQKLLSGRTLFVGELD